MKPTIDAFGVRGEVTFPADEALSAEPPKVPSKDCWVQTELRREEVGVQIKKSAREEVGVQTKKSAEFEHRISDADDVDVLENCFS